MKLWNLELRVLPEIEGRSIVYEEIQGYIKSRNIDYQQSLYAPLLHCLLVVACSPLGDICPHRVSRARLPSVANANMQLLHLGSHIRCAEW
jgi:hypothetical protein